MTALAIQCLLCFHTNCEIICSCSVNNIIGSLIWMLIFDYSFDFCAFDFSVRIFYFSITHRVFSTTLFSKLADRFPCSIKYIVDSLLFISFILFFIAAFLYVLTLC